MEPHSMKPRLTPKLTRGVIGLTHHAGMHQLAAAAAILGIGVLVGLLLSRVVLARLRRGDRVSQWAAIRAAQGVVVVASTAIGAYGASLALPLTRGVATTQQKCVWQCEHVFCYPLPRPPPSGG